jgi:hypothetical protein
VTEAEWLACKSPFDMLDAVERIAARDRKFQLFSIAAARLAWSQAGESRPAECLDVAEKWADGLCDDATADAALLTALGEDVTSGTGANRRRALHLAGNALMPGGYFTALDAVMWFADAEGWDDDIRVQLCGYLRCLFGCGLSAPPRRRLTAVLVGLAKALGGSPLQEVPDDDRPFRPRPRAPFDPAWLTSTALALARGIYDDRAFDRLPILADALEEAGCDDAEVLGHCRGPGPHVRGCWVVDMLLGMG